MSAQDFSAPTIDDLRIAETRGYREAPFKYADQRTIRQRLGQLAGEKLRRAAESKVGRFIVAAARFLKPSAGPVTPEQPALKTNDTEPKWADLLQPEHKFNVEGLRLLGEVAAALRQEVLHGARPEAAPAHVEVPENEFDDVTVGLFTDEQLDRIEEAFAVVQGPSRPMFVAPSDYPTAEYELVGSSR